MKNRSASKLLVLITGILILLMLANIMSASGSFMDTESSTNSFSAWTWRQWMQTTPSDFSNDVLNNTDALARPGSVLLSNITHYIFAFQGNDHRAFWRYDQSSRVWATMSRAPATIGDGGCLAYVGGMSIYALRGNNQRNFWKYNITTNTWSSMANTPSDVRYGGCMAFDGQSSIYAFPGNGLNSFWRYNLLTNSWTVLANAPGTVRDGGAMIYDPTTSCVYAFQGNDQHSLWKYDIGRNAWTALTPTSADVRFGGAMTTDRQGHIYAFFGDNLRAFWRYDISSNTWAALASSPVNVRYGGALAFDGPGRVYAFPGQSRSVFYRYDVPSNTWLSETSAPGAVQAGGSLAAGPVLYRTSGRITSSVLDSGIMGCKVYGLYWDGIAKSTNRIEFEVRASDSLVGGYPGSSWTNVGGSSPVTTGLPSGRYLQWRATMTTSEAYITPVLQEVRIYYSDS